jgi:hypothetical protein
MKLSAYMTLTMVIACSAVQAASAQDAPRGARFNYAPNVWRAEHANIPKGYGDYVEPTHAVKQGSMPSKNLLGLDPMMLSKPAPTPPVPQTNVTATAQAPKTNASFMPAFGKPMLAQAPVMPQAATAKPYVPVKPEIAAPAQAAPQPAVVASNTKSVSGRVHVPTRHVPAPESATPHVASYSDSDRFYTPSTPTLPSSGGGTATTKVSATLITKSKHLHQ